jgi:hypothetical protein
VRGAELSFKFFSSASREVRRKIGHVYAGDEIVFGPFDVPMTIDNDIGS